VIRLFDGISFDNIGNRVAGTGMYGLSMIFISTGNPFGPF